MRKGFYKALMVFMLLVSFISIGTQCLAEVYTSISGYVTLSENGQLITNVEVYAIKQATEETVLLKATTDSKGLYVINRVPSGAYKIYIRPSTDYWWDGIGKDVTVPVGKNVLNVIFKVDRSASISGKVTDQNGNPVSNAEVLAQNPNKGVVKTTTDSTGNYFIAGLSGKETAIVGIIAEGVGSSFKEGVSLSKGALTPNIDFAITKTVDNIALKGKITSAAVAPVGNAVLVLFSDDSRTMAWTKTDEQGNYYIYNLPTNSYSIEVLAAGYERVLQEGLSISKGQVKTLDLQLPERVAMNKASFFNDCKNKLFRSAENIYDIFVPDSVAYCDVCNKEKCDDIKDYYTKFSAEHQNDSYSMYANNLLCNIKSICGNVTQKKYENPSWVICVSNCLLELWKPLGTKCWEKAKVLCDNAWLFSQTRCALKSMTCHWGEDLQVCQGSQGSVCGLCNSHDIDIFKQNIFGCGSNIITAGGAYTSATFYFSGCDK